MRAYTVLLAALLTAPLCFLALSEDALAQKRLGGGKTVMPSSPQKAPVKPPAPPAPKPSEAKTPPPPPGTKALDAQKTPPPPPGAPPSSLNQPPAGAPGAPGAFGPGQSAGRPPLAPPPAAQPSFMSRVGGIVGGVLVGGLIGSMLFGGGSKVGGWGGPSFFDLLLIGGLAFLGWKLWKAKKQAAFAGAQPGQAKDDFPDLSRFEGSAAKTAAPPAQPVFSTDPAPASTPPTPTQASDVQPAPPAPPKSESGRVMPHFDLPGDETPRLDLQKSEGFGDVPDFDAPKFLDGAKSLFIALQAAWDKRDLAAVKAFSTEPFYAEIERQAQDDPSPGETEILLLNAKPHGFFDEGGRDRAAVLFDALIREDKSEDRAKPVREVWHFIRMKGQPEGWLLAGIEQVEDMKF